ncbi:unnamed protein product [Rotaria sordida]|uniref:Uncharacterized protein n=1 Tax=Rotaria sordida TaxID=392033 RepID=A0A814C381_9BILA|nr:unnamed protein product [Rotaria sordida]CAF4038846.1 unnamed protein product [Rotaria sordida]
MNCSTTTDIQNRYFLIGNFGALVFMIIYIGFYGMGMIVYFTCQFMNESRDNHENKIPDEFFSTFHHINERQEIYNQLTDENLIKKLYKIYYSNEPNNSKFIEEKVNQCSKKYHLKIQNLKSRHAYYVIETLTPPTLTTISYTN